MNWKTWTPMKFDKPKRQLEETKMTNLTWQEFVIKVAENQSINALRQAASYKEDRAVFGVYSSTDKFEDDSQLMDIKFTDSKVSLHGVKDTRVYVNVNVSYTQYQLMDMTESELDKYLDMIPEMVLKQMYMFQPLTHPCNIERDLIEIEPEPFPGKVIMTEHPMHMKMENNHMIPCTVIQMGNGDPADVVDINYLVNESIKNGGKNIKFVLHSTFDNHICVKDTSPIIHKHKLPKQHMDGTVLFNEICSIIRYITRNIYGSNDDYNLQMNKQVIITEKEIYVFLHVNHTLIPLNSDYTFIHYGGSNLERIIGMDLRKFKAHLRTHKI